MPRRRDRGPRPSTWRASLRPSRARQASPSSRQGAVEIADHDRSAETSQQAGRGDTHLVRRLQSLPQLVPTSVQLLPRICVLCLLRSTLALPTGRRLHREKRGFELRRRGGRAALRLRRGALLKSRISPRAFQSAVKHAHLAGHRVCATRRSANPTSPLRQRRATFSLHRRSLAALLSCRCLQVAQTACNEAATPPEPLLLLSHLHLLERLERLCWSYDTSERCTKRVSMLPVLFLQRPPLDLHASPVESADLCLLSSLSLLPPRSACRFRSTCLASAPRKPALTR